jgi:3-oxoacyl-[acyl-carrier protein] reductase
MIDLTEKVVLVTGASRGIGAASARVLAAADASVILHYGRSLEQAQALADEIGPRASLVQADLSKPGAARGLWHEALAIHGRIDVLVNNAGILFDAPPEADDETWARAWQEMLQVNLVAVADLCREAIATFPQNSGKTKGVIVNISSRAAFMGSTAARMPYAASKAGVLALTRSIARSYAKAGVLAYALAPGFVQSDMADYSIEQYGLEKLLADNPMGEMAPPEDVAHTVAFLASGLVPHMTGATLDINGASYVR